MARSVIFFFLFLPSIVSYAQEIRYDTTYQVTYENGIKDSVIIIYKRVLVTERVYVVDSSTLKKKWAVDVFVNPFFSTTSSASSEYSTENISNQNKIKAHIGQSIGANLYYLKKNIEFRANLNFSRHSLKITSDRSLSSFVTTNYFVDDTLDVYYAVGPNQDTTYFYIIEQKPATRTDQKIENQKRDASAKLYYFEIAFQAGYKRIYKNWTFYLYGGPVVGFLLTSKGYTFDERGETRDIREEKISSPLFHAQANLQMSYSYRPGAQIFAEPFYQKYLFTINRTSTPAFNKDFWGLRLGMKIFL